MNDPTRGSTLDPTARLATILGAVGGLVSMFIVGHRQRSVLLMVLFATWVVSPFVALALVRARASAWPPPSRRITQYAAMLISIGALATYMYVIVRPLKSQPASTFLIVPFVSWVAVVVVAAFAGFTSRRGRSEGAQG